MPFKRFFKSKTKELPVFLPYQRASNDFCNECFGECTSVCKEEIIIKKVGIPPYLNFNTSGCVFCKKCAQVCYETYGEESVLDPSLEDKIQAYARIDVLSCLAYHQVICSSCRDRCKDAIKFSGMFYPEVLETCTGCGLCVSACPKDSISILARE